VSANRCSIDESRITQRNTVRPEMMGRRMVLDQSAECGKGVGRSEAGVGIRGTGNNSCKSVFGYRADCSTLLRSDSKPIVCLVVMDMKAIHQC